MSFFTFFDFLNSSTLDLPQEEDAELFDDALDFELLEDDEESEELLDDELSAELDLLFFLCFLFFLVFFEFFLSFLCFLSFFLDCVEGCCSIMGALNLFDKLNSLPAWL